MSIRFRSHYGKKHKYKNNSPIISSPIINQNDSNDFHNNNVDNIDNSNYFNDDNVIGHDDECFQNQIRMDENEILSDSSEYNGLDCDDEKLFIPDTYADCLRKNISLNEFFLRGATVLVSNEYIESEHQITKIFEGSEINVLDFVLYIEFIKHSMALGDKNEALIVGMLASALPKPNYFSESLREKNKTTYGYLQIIKNMTKCIPKASILECSICSKGCVAFVGELYEETVCPICHLEKEQVYQYLHKFNYKFNVK